MRKISKPVIKKHKEACALLKKEGALTQDERIFVFENWHEGVDHDQSWAGAFFTPWDMAATGFRIEARAAGRRVIDLCAGIGILSYASCVWANFDTASEIVCVERNPHYVEVGKKVLPEARWICADVFDLPKDLGHFDVAISNPPFGRVPKNGTAPRYTGPEFEYHVMDISADLADYGVFIIPQESASFRYSGVPYFMDKSEGKHLKFQEQTGIRIDPNCGIDTSMWSKEWRNTIQTPEIVVCDYQEMREHQRHETKEAHLFETELEDLAGVENEPALHINSTQGNPVQLSLFDWAA